MEQNGNYEARERILNASMQLFSQKGYDATRVNEIAGKAGVTKALIYYYFKSKEDILDCLVHSLLEKATSITMGFVHANVVKMIKDGKLDIEPDRLHFTSEQAIQHFLENACVYYEEVFNFVLKNRHILRILMLESLKSSKHHNDLFQLMDFTKGSEDNPIFKTISEADKDFTYSDDMVLFNFFFFIIPMVSFAVYYDDYRETSALNDEQLRAAFLRSSQIVFASLISGSDILLQNKKT